MALGTCIRVQRSAHLDSLALHTWHPLVCPTLSKFLVLVLVICCVEIRSSHRTLPNTVYLGYSRPVISACRLASRGRLHNRRGVVDCAVGRGV